MSEAPRAVSAPWANPAPAAVPKDRQDGTDETAPDMGHPEEAGSSGDTGQYHTGAMHTGLPPLDKTAPPLSFFEMWRPIVFYAPLFVWWAYLGIRYRGLTLPTIANPLFPAGGLIGESKACVLNTVSQDARRWIAPFVTIDVPDDPVPSGTLLDRVLSTMEDAGLTFPVAIKPDIGSRGAGVRLAKSACDVEAYLRAFPRGETVMLQAFVPYEAEAGVFYVREPDAEMGRIISLTLKYFPYVTGDGQATLRELIERDPRAGKLSHLYLARHEAHLEKVLAEGEAYRLAFAGSHSRGTIFKDGNPYITPEMTEAFDRIAKAIPEFYFGRFDVRFPSLEDLQAGRDFVIIEVNGAGAEATHVWDSRTPLLKAYKDLAEQYRLLFAIGFQNRKRGYKPMPLLKLIWRYWHELKLTPNYPPTE